MTDLLQAALTPASVAIIGASDNPHKIGGRPIFYMQRHGYRGTIYPINPNRSEIQGLPCYASLADLPRTPELALVIVSGENAVDGVAECARLGVKAAIVIASGFGETGAAGRAVQDAMTRQACAAGMRLIGPNTQGLANFGSGTIASFSTMFVEVPPADGPVAVVSQSGGTSSVIYGLLRGRGIGVRYVHATGNEADVGVADLAWAVAHDSGIKLLLLYLETIADPQLLARTAEYARERDLPIVAIKAGRSRSGQQAASSHTGALANEDRVVDAFFRHHAIWRVRDPHQLVLAADAYLHGWRPAGRRLVVISNSGASCVMAADLSEDMALPLAELAPRTRRDVAAKLPGFASAANPIDVTAALLQNSALFGDVLPILARDRAADLFCLSVPVAGTGYDVEAFARDAAACADMSAKPVVIAAWQESVARVFRAAGLATYADEREALSVLAQLVEHSALLRRERCEWPQDAPPDLPAGRGRFLNEADSLALLAAAGVPVVAHRLCRSASEVHNAFAELGGRVALKACSGDIPHKARHGLVALNIDTAAAAERIFRQQWQQLETMAVSRDGVLVAAMQRGRHELMIGARVDPLFGPLVMIGDGGRYVETLPDYALLLPPFDRADVHAALAGLRIAPLLDGSSGAPALDSDAIADIAIAVGRLICAARAGIASLDLNPVLVGAVGEETVVVDGLIERRL